MYKLFKRPNRLSSFLENSWRRGGLVRYFVAVPAITVIIFLVGLAFVIALPFIMVAIVWSDPKVILRLFSNKDESNPEQG